MARVYINGFETGDFSECAGSSSGGAVATDTVRTGAYAAKFTAGSTYRETKTGLNLSTGFIRCYVYIAGTPSAASAFIDFDDTSDRGISGITLLASLKLQYHNYSGGSDVTLGTGTITLTTGVWHYIELKTVISAGSGIIEGRIDGIVDATFTGLTTNGRGNIDRADFGPGNGTLGVNCWFDDIAIDDAAYPGVGQIIARQGAAGTPTYDAWTKNGAATAALCWSDTPFSTATNCTDAVLSDAQTMLVSAFSAMQTGHGTQIVGSADTVNACKVALIAKESTAGTAKIRRRVNSADTDTAITTTTSDAYFDDGIWTTTTANLDFLEAGAVSQSGSLTTTVEDVWVIVEYTPAAAPFLQSDWPNPRGYPYPTQNRNVDPPNRLVPALLQGSRLVPFYQTDWPNPNRGYRRSVMERRDDPENRLVLGLIPGRVSPPFNQTDWPNPKAYPYRLRDWQQPTNPLINVLQQPFNQTDWPLPKTRYYQLRDWQQPAQPIFMTLQKPFNQTDWPNPKTPYYQLRDWQLEVPNLNTTTLPGDHPTPFNQSDWPLPKTPAYRLRDWQSPPNYLPAGLPEPPGADPFYQTDWPLPKGPAYRLRDWPQPPNLALTILPGSRTRPFSETDWPLPNRGAPRMVPGYGFTQNRPFYYRDAPPFAGHRRGFPRLPRSATTYQIIDAINRLLSGESETPSPYQIDMVADNFSINFPAAFKYLLLNPAGALTTGQITLPIDAVDRDRLWIATTQNITTLTVLPGSGQTLLNAPTSLSAGTSISFVYVASSLTWFRLQ